MPYSKEIWKAKDPKDLFIYSSTGICHGPSVSWEKPGVLLSGCYLSTIYSFPCYCSIKKHEPLHKRQNKLDSLPFYSQSFSGVEVSPIKMLNKWFPENCLPLLSLICFSIFGNLLLGCRISIHNKDIPGKARNPLAVAILMLPFDGNAFITW